MLTPLSEPVAPRFIYVNPANNTVHLLVPLVGGQEISTDNTCQATISLQDFFEGGAGAQALEAYKSALESDLRLLPQDHPLTAAKQHRLTQIYAYIQAFPIIQARYQYAVTGLMSVPSNLYSIQLRPRAQDHYSRVVNPVFNINRTNDATGTPLSALYNAMHAAFPGVTLAGLEPRAQLNQSVLSALPEGASFADIQRTLTDQCQRLFGLEINFTQGSDGMPIDQGGLNETITGDRDAALTPQEYIDALLGSCALNMWESITTPPFYRVPDNKSKTEKLSILTQFFLAQVNIYCKANKISDRNFGHILDASPELSQEVAVIVVSAVGSGACVEDSLCTFITNHASEFGLSRALAPEDMNLIKQKFERTYVTVTGTTENPHMDDFMILDVTQPDGKCVTHQGSICTDFTELLAPELDNEYFQSIRADFEAPSERVIPHKNEHIEASIEMSVAEILAHFDGEKFEELPPKVRLACMKDPAFAQHTFLPDVAKGKQDDAEGILADNPRAQELLRTPGRFTDYSGRTFNCTPYEYAYWAKDKHMQRMLERHMDDETKADMLARIDEMERIDPVTEKPVGLVYIQHGTEHRSAHYDFTPLLEALRRYVEGYDNWDRTDNIDAMKAAWMEVGQAQRDVPAHVAQEYCRPNRSFHPTPKFNEVALPRGMTFYNYNTESPGSWFPLRLAATTGLGVDFALISGWTGARGCGDRPGWAVRDDLKAASHLDKVRTADLTRSRENLRLVAPEHGPGLAY